MRVAITGAGGLIGSFLAERLSSQGHDLHLLSRSPIENINGLSGAAIHNGDIRDRASVERFLKDAEPDLIYHLAAQSLPSQSWKDPHLTFDVNVNGTINILEAMKGLKKDALLLSVCSSAEYKASVNPISEDDPLDPSSPYGISKLAQDHFTQIYANLYGLRTIRCRPFFLIGPRKNGDAASSFAKQIAAIEKGHQKVLNVGNLLAIRDLLDVRDGVMAMETLAEKGKEGEAYNICSGSGISLEQTLSLLISMSTAEIKTKEDRALFRPNDLPKVIGNPQKLMKLGWKPHHRIESTLKDILDYWRSRS
ncbi:MAG: hypothetical protein A2Z88_11605 [Omnitrophica WOR_2 bacterium GWA2_47_8]|nr:MAG: hypothetical protein A2Z88_11605 [Omnitrophica WOR_2 bacterium GWA2_47_8]